jgi:hypothetical protein
MGKKEKFDQDFKLEPINVKKALDTLDLDPKAESKLAKALVGTRSVMEKTWTPSTARSATEGRRSPGN